MDTYFITEIIALIIFKFVIYGIYKGISFLAKKIVSIENIKFKNKSKISEIIIPKTISRRGKLYDYEFKFNPNVEIFHIRILSKILDFCFYYLTLNFIIQNPVNIGLISFTFLFLLNPFIEFITGTTFGKFIFRLEIIDDFGKKPSLIKLIIKNLLQIGQLIVLFTTDSSVWEEEIYFHNKRTLTYTIYKKEKNTIMEKLNNSKNSNQNIVLT